MKLPRNFREILKSELALRIQKNPRYSLRAFARDLEISAARLSEILNHEKGLSREAAFDIAQKLGFNRKEQTFFCDLVESQHARNSKTREEALKRVEHILQHEASDSEGHARTLPLDSFRLIEDWYHLAILQYLKLKDARQDYAEMAEVFEISEHQVRDACERMLRLNLLTRNGQKLVPTEHWVFAGSHVPSQSIKKHHEQIFERAVKALYERPLHERTFRSSVFACELADLAEIEAKILKFSKSIIKQYASQNSNAEIMAIGMQAFPLTKRNPGKTR